MYLCTFGQNPFTTKDDNARKPYVDADDIRTKNNIIPHTLGFGDINT